MKMWSCHFQADSVRTWGLWKAAILYKSVGVRLRSLILLCFPSLPTGRGLTLAGCSSPPRAPHPPPADSTLSDEPAKCCSYLLDSAFWRGTPCPCIPPPPRGSFLVTHDRTYFIFRFYTNITVSPGIYLLRGLLYPLAV